MESLIALWISDGDRCQILTTFREDPALAPRLGDALPAATTMQDSLKAFHAEQDRVLHDEGRDGHIPAGCGNVRALEQAVATLPEGIHQIRVRADSTLYESGVLRWSEARGIDYVIRADFSQPRRAEITRLPEAAWPSSSGIGGKPAPCGTHPSYPQERGCRCRAPQREAQSERHLVSTERADL